MEVESRIIHGIAHTKNARTISEPINILLREYRSERTPEKRLNKKKGRVLQNVILDNSSPTFPPSFIINPNSAI